MVKVKKIFLIFVIIFILVGVTLIVIGLKNNFKESRNNKRITDVALILNTVYQYYINNDGSLPLAIQEDENCLDPNTIVEICKKGYDTLICLENQKIPMPNIIDSGEYIDNWPVDPTGENEFGIGYNIIKSNNGRITVCAPYAEGINIINISITR